MRATKMLLSVTLLLALAAPCLGDRPSAASNDAEAVGQATSDFYKGLNALFTGDASPMNQVWSHADDVTYMGPGGGILIGWERVRDIWESQAALKLGGEVLPDEVSVTVGGDLAIVCCREVGNNLDADGRPLQVSIRATNVFRKENGEWKMIGNHTDLLPFLDGQSAATAAN
jgi:ketosteroid isomerase-like protein